MTDTTEAKPIRVLLVDDEPTLLRALESLLRKKGYDVTGLDSPIVATQKLAQEDYDVALLDIKMPQLSGLELLSAVKHRRPEVEVIMMTGHATVETALAAVRAGAYDYLTKPFDDVELVARAVAKAAERKMLFDRNRQLESALREREGVPGEGLVGNSAPMREVTRMIDAVAYSAATVLVTGESGTGKELVARAIHARSPRKGHPFVALNCGALTETLLESELFGHVKGAFTGAQRDQKGLFDAADGGTIFLDEIGDIPLATQVTLLRVLQEGEIKRVGSADSVKVDVRIIAATHRDLPKLVKVGQVPRGPVLPAQRHQHPAAAAARAGGGHPAARPPLPAALRRAAGQEGPGALARGHRAARAGTAGRATSASSRTPSSGRWCCAAARSSPRPTCRRRSPAGPPRWSGRCPPAATSRPG